MPKSKSDELIAISSINTGRSTFCIIGKTPILLHSMPEKALHEFLAPRGKKTSAEKKNSIKHDPFKEFNESPYKLPNPKAPTFIAQIATAMKNSIRYAAVDIPGATKAQLGRLLWVEGEYIPIYGIPKMHMAIVRSSDQNRTPDVRTRLVISEWAAEITITYVKPHINDEALGHLINAAGLTQGLGDWRPQKGSGTYGQYELCETTNKDFQRIVKTGGRALQIKAMKNPESYDAMTEKLLSWYAGELPRLGVAV